MSVVQVPFTQWTHQDNHFIIIDETIEPLLFEQQKPEFAAPAIDAAQDSGANKLLTKLLIIQPCRAETLRAIHCVHQYWDNLPDAKKADFIVRAYKPDGREVLPCRDGLLCATGYLQRQYGVDIARIMAHMPLNQPQLLALSIAQSTSQQFAAPRLLTAGHLREDIGVQILNFA